MVPDNWLTSLHASFLSMHVRGEVAGWPFNPERIDPPESAPLYVCCLVLVAGLDRHPLDLTCDELCELAKHGLSLIDAGVRTLEAAEAEIGQLLAALQAEHDEYAAMMN